LKTIPCDFTISNQKLYYVTKAIWQNETTKVAFKLMGVVV